MQLEFTVTANSLAKSETTGLQAATQSPPELQVFLDCEPERVATLEQILCKVQNSIFNYRESAMTAGN